MRNCDGLLCAIFSEKERQNRRRQKKASSPKEKETFGEKEKEVFQEKKESGGGKVRWEREEGKN